MTEMGRISQIASKLVVYQVVHCYDTDNGIGDAEYKERVVETFENESDAKAFVSEFARPHVYDRPYSNLRCGRLEVRKIEIVRHDNFDLNAIDTSSFWWLKKSMWEEIHENDPEEEEEED